MLLASRHAMLLFPESVQVVKDGIYNRRGECLESGMAKKPNQPHHPVSPDDTYREQEKQNKIPPSPEKEDEFEEPNWSRDRFKNDIRYDLAS